jgi:hypothetical protein
VSRNKKVLTETPDLTELLSIGVFSKIVPKPIVDRALEQLDRASKRVRLFPASAVVYFVMAMSLFRNPPMEEILRIFTEACKQLSRQEGIDFPIPNKSAISQARSRLGSDVMRLIADDVLKPIAPPDFSGAWYRGMRIMAIDGTCFDVPDESENVAFFGYPSFSRGETAFPQVRVVALVETGTKKVTAAEFGPYKTSEQVLTTALINRAKLTPEMLLLADRNFVGYPLWSRIMSSEAKVLWRAKVGLNLPILESFPDGSNLSRLRDSKNAKLPDYPIRVIEYNLKDEKLPPGSENPGQEKYRLVTNIFDHKLAPALELAALYHERWEIETLYREFKTSLQGASTTLRSKTPELVLQELWGLLLVHFTLRVLMAESAWQVGIDPDKLSFLGAVRIVQRKVPLMAVFPPNEM